jgi:hypothetical protein
LGSRDRDPCDSVRQPDGRPFPQRLRTIGGESPAQATFLVEVADHLLRFGDLARRLLPPGFREAKPAPSSAVLRWPAPDCRRSMVVRRRPEIKGR